MSEPTKLNVLDEVRADAKYLYLKRLREQEADKAYEEAKLTGSVDELLDKELTKPEQSKESK